MMTPHYASQFYGPIRFHLERRRTAIATFDVEIYAVGTERFIIRPEWYVPIFARILDIAISPARGASNLVQDLTGDGVVKSNTGNLEGPSIYDERAMARLTVESARRTIVPSKMGFVAAINAASEYRQRSNVSPQLKMPVM